MITQNNYLYYTFRLSLLLLDMFLINASFCIVYFYLSPEGTLFNDVGMRHSLLVFNMLWWLSTGHFRLYTKETIRKLKMIYRATWKSLVLQAFLFLLYIVFISDVRYSNYSLILLLTTVCLSLAVSRFIGTIMEDRIKRNLAPRKTVAILGHRQICQSLGSFLENNNRYFNFVGYLPNAHNSYSDISGRLSSEVSATITEAAQKGVQEIYMPLTMGLTEAGNLLKEAEKQCIRLKFVPICLDESICPQLKIDSLGDFQVISLRKEPLQDISNLFRKRAFDFIFSAVVIVFLLSWLYPLIALIIKIQSKGPVLFKQKRTGMDNETFICYKFRTMYINHESDTLQATKDDCRITPFGRFMRKTNLDELPQFFNVLKGDMSVVGPRPHMLKHTQKYSAMINQFMVRHFLKPGITGWAQVNGFRGETKYLLQMKKRIEHDIWYLGNWSSMLDLRIVFLTVVNMFKGEENAY